MNKQGNYIICRKGYRKGYHRLKVHSSQFHLDVNGWIVVNKNDEETYYPPSAIERIIYLGMEDRD